MIDGMPVNPDAVPLAREVDVKLRLERLGVTAHSREWRELHRWSQQTLPTVPVLVVAYVAVLLRQQLQLLPLAEQAVVRSILAPAEPVRQLVAGRVPEANEGRA